MHSSWLRIQQRDKNWPPRQAMRGGGWIYFSPSAFRN
jgi:hypothetical protein